MLSGVDLPAQLDDVMKSFKALDPDGPRPTLLLRATVAIPASGAMSFDGVSIAAALPINPPAAIRDDFLPWFDSAALRLELGVGPSGPFAKVAGDLTIRLADGTFDPSTDTSDSACADAGKFWQKSRSDKPDFACYDRLEFSASIEIKVTVPPTILITGSLRSNGWSPFGPDVLTINAATLQFGIEDAPTPVLTIGMLGAGKLFGKDFSARSRSACAS